MTISALEPRVEYSGNGTTRNFTVTFPFLKKSYVHVFVDGEETKDFEWTALVDREGKAGYQANAKVWLRNAPAADAEVVIYRETPITQNADWRVTLGFLAETTERAFDKLTMIFQELAMWMNRMVAPPEETNVGGGPYDPTLQWVIEARPGILVSNDGGGVYTFQFGTWDAGTDEFIVDPDDETEYTGYEFNAIDDMEPGKLVRVMVFLNEAGNIDYRIHKYMDYVEPVPRYKLVDCDESEDDIIININTADLSAIATQTLSGLASSLNGIKIDGYSNWWTVYEYSGEGIAQSISATAEAGPCPVHNCGTCPFSESSTATFKLVNHEGTFPLTGVTKSASPLTYDALESSASYFVMSGISADYYDDPDEPCRDYTYEGVNYAGSQTIKVRYVCAADKWQYSIGGSPWVDCSAPVGYPASGSSDCNGCLFIYDDCPGEYVSCEITVSG